MSFDEIKSELAKMPKDQQDRLAAYLVHLRHQRDPDLRKELTAKINDKSPDKWIALNDLKEKWKD